MNVFEVLALLVINAIIYLVGVSLIYIEWGYCDHKSEETLIGVFIIMFAVAISLLIIGMVI